MHVRNLTAMIRNRLSRESIYSTAEYWDSKVDEFQDEAISMWPNNKLNRLYEAEQKELLEHELGELQGKRVLDLGCGTGRISRFLSTRGASVVGVDFSSKAIEVARSLSQGENPRYEVGSILELDKNLGEFDLVVSWGSVAIACRTTQDLEKVFVGVRRLLNRGGKILFLEPIHRGFLHRVLNMSVEEFARNLEKEGFSIERIFQLHFWPVRILLGYWNLPEVVTRVMYHAGQFTMRLLPGRWGDYTAISAITK